MTTPPNSNTTFQRATTAFDAITNTKASYYGLNFKTVLADNPEALEAAERLARFVFPQPE